MKTTTGRTLKRLREMGWDAAVVERYLAVCRVRQDMFGFADVLAFSEDRVLAVQTTTQANFAAHKPKIEALLVARRWVASDLRALELWGWAKRGERGKRKLWTVRRERVFWTERSGAFWEVVSDIQNNQTDFKTSEGASR